uniref:BMERB domain-containing protein n=1 Tax=Ascaris lumbricoides TaxID=6252 RepID=A0A9J2Q5I8_ASCLU
MQHINVPILEKIARIEKLDSRASAKADLLKVNPLPNTSSDGTSMVSVSPTKSDSPMKLNNGSDKNRSPKVMSELKELNSPAALLGKTIERMRAQREAASVVSMVAGRVSGSTPERVEFENFKRNLRADLNARKKEQQRISEGECVSTGDEIDPAVPFSDEVSGSATSSSEEENSIAEREHVVDDDVSSSDEDEFMEADLVELEKTVLENIDRNLNETLTDEQAISLLRSFNLRRTSTPQTLKVSLEGQSPNATKFFTPRSTRHTFRSPSADAYCTPEGSSVFRTPLASPPKASVTGRSESLKSVRERAVVSLADYREKARMRARLKSDEQLGLRHVASGRFSMPIERPAASTTSHLRHQLSLNEHSSRNEVIERREPTLVNQMPASDPQTPKTSSPHPSTPTQSDTDVKRDSAPMSPCSPSGRGLLARLFSPDPRRINKQSSQAPDQKNTISAPLAADEIAATSLDDSPASELPTANIESQKETTILERLSSLRKLRHRKLNTTDSNEKGTESGGDDLQCSPNSAPPHSSPLSLNEKNIRRIQKRAGKIVQQKEQERVRTAQDIQRALQETEIRKAEVNAVGADLERRLKDDSENRWVLEQWLLYVHEMDQLKLREADLLRRVGEMEAVDEYKRLQKQLNELQKADSGIERGGSGHTEKDLLKRMLAAIEKRDAIHRQMEKANIRTTRSSFSDPQTLLAEKGASYRNFEPVFLK